MAIFDMQADFADKLTYMSIINLQRKFFSGIGYQQAFKISCETIKKRMN